MIQLPVLVVVYNEIFMCLLGVSRPYIGEYKATRRWRVIELGQNSRVLCRAKLHVGADTENRSRSEQIPGRE